MSAPGSCRRRPAGKTLDGVRRQEFRALAQEQGRLAELLLQKLQPAPQNPEEPRIGCPSAAENRLRGFAMKTKSTPR